MAVKRLEKEFQEVQTRGALPDGFTVVLRGDYIKRWRVTITFQGGKYDLDIDFPDDYPFRPPALKFVTGIRHPAVVGGYVTNAAFADQLRDQWSPAISTKKLLAQLDGILRDCDPTLPAPKTAQAQALVSAAAPRSDFCVGQKVKMRRRRDEPWRYGRVTTVTPELTVDGGTWEFVHPPILELSGTGLRPSDVYHYTGREYKSLRKHPSLFDPEAGWQEDWFDPDFLAAMRALVEDGTEGAWSSLVEEHLPGKLFSCRMFSKKFCDMLIEEVDNFATTGLPATRPNSMNNYGIILNDIGWKPMMNVLQDNILARIAAMYWPHMAPFDKHHTFIVRYKEDEDRGLDMHTDDSDVTFNLCLGREFSGAGLSFCGVFGQPDHRQHSFTYRHGIGVCCWHRGRQRHGADDITAGERLNLIVWNTSSRYRRSQEYRDPPWSREQGPPDPVCLSFTHDRDYGVFREYTDSNRDHQGRGWCPKRAYEYDGFRQEPSRPAFGLDDDPD